MNKKFLIFLSVITSTSAGCSKVDNKILCLSNINNFYNEKIDEVFLEGTNESIRNLMDTNLGFILYIHDEECSSCKTFDSIIFDFSKKNEHLIVEVANSNIIEFYNDFKNDFFNVEEITLPYVGIVKGTELTHVDNAKYMKTKNAFSNFIRANCKVQNIFYTNQNIKTLKNKNQFTHVLLKNSDKSSMNLYSTKVFPLIENSKNNIVITPNNNEFEIAQIETNYQTKEKIQITEETESNQINKFF